MLSLIALSLAIPIDDDQSAESAERSASGTNWLYQQINGILKRGIEKHTNSSDSLEVGDKIKTPHFSINVQQFGNGNDFPVHFRPQDSADHPDVLESATVIALVDDFDGSSEFVIRQKSSSEESSEESKENTKTTAKVNTTSTSGSSSTVPSTTLSNGSSTTTALSTTANSTEATTTTTKH